MGKKVGELNESSYLGIKLVTGVKGNDFIDSGLDNTETNRMVKGVIPEKSESSVKNIDARVYPEPVNCVSHMISDEEKELAFLRSLGWDENAEEDPLTEEEINAFYQQYNGYIHGKRRL
ncbi:hypothetical protein SUGI_0049040 [Cryptomeria japonica]|nr:hypothetical protein SUGI_0049040 [Cryptomeria japonica]